MEQFSSSIDNYLDYLRAQQAAHTLELYNEWFGNFYEEPDDTEILEKFKDCKDCGTRTATKEMLDFLAITERNRYIRNKKRNHFFVSNAVRCEGAIHRLKNKKLRLADMII